METRATTKSIISKVVGLHFRNRRRLVRIMVAARRTSPTISLKNPQRLRIAQHNGRVHRVEGRKIMSGRRLLSKNQQANPCLRISQSVREVNRRTPNMAAISPKYTSKMDFTGVQATVTLIGREAQASSGQHPRSVHGKAQINSVIVRDCRWNIDDAATGTMPQMLVSNNSGDSWS